MAAIANVVLVNYAAANKTYTPVGITPVAQWRDNSNAILIGNPELSMGIRMPSPTAKTMKVQLKLVLPTMEVTAGSTGSGLQAAPTVAYKNIANVELVLHERTSLADRRDLLALIKSALGNAVMTAAVENFEKPV